jgi:hypothetical protein
MPSRPDLREITSNVKDAFADMDRDTLLEILTFVVKEYVVEGPPPMLVHQAESLSDLQGATFAQIISALQTRFDFPELQAFVVDGEQVGVRIGGVVQPLLGRAGAQPAATELPRPAAGVRVVEAAVQQRPAPAPAPAAQPGQAPPPTRGISLRGRPSDGEAPAAPPPAAQPQQPPAQGAAPQAAAPEDKKEGGGDDASARFSLLELD